MPNDTMPTMCAVSGYRNTWSGPPLSPRQASLLNSGSFAQYWPSMIPPLNAAWFLSSLYCTYVWLHCDNGTVRNRTSDSASPVCIEWMKLFRMNICILNYTNRCSVLLSAFVVPQPLTWSGTFWSWSFTSISKQAGLTSGVNWIRLESWIKAMSFFFVRNE